MTDNRDEANYSLDYSIDAGLVVTVDISLLKNGKSLIINASATNVWAGTLIARPVAIANRVSDAVDELDELLSESETLYSN